ncbi:GGDEF domain-containing protein [Psychromonas hadalis]|uniref:GGDEF domain-containing protein n=1 Tax=Psychromonas hadalis TaxID=211669 RepID=UPI0003B768BB|nr:GGDEF domain-containing protein [Psychromonas hadalis]
MSQRAYQDNLTGLANRQQFVIAFENSVKMSIQKKRNISLLLIDLNGLKQINQIHGHKSGDLVISTFASLLSQCILFSDQVFRYGGDQFVVILNQTEETSISALVEHICHLLDSNIIMEEFDITCSIGRADVKEYDDFNSLIERTEQSLSIIKNVQLSEDADQVEYPLYDLVANGN